MSQLLACRARDGIVLAADRRVVVDREGVAQEHSVRKLFPLGPRAAVATSGAAVGIAVTRVLSRLLRHWAPLPFGELETYALAVFQKEYDQFVRQGKKWFAAHPEAHRSSYVLLGGLASAQECALRFHASEEHGQPYRRLSIRGVVAAPRRIGLETRLARAAGEDPGEVIRLAVEGLRRIASREEAVGGPFDVVFLSTEGARWQTFGDADPDQGLRVT